MTMAEPCRDWARALEADLLGEPLSDDARRRAREHERDCAACAAERDALRGLRAHSVEERAGFVDGVLEAFDRRKIVRLRSWPLVTAAVAVAAACALFVHAHRAPEAAAPAISTPTPEPLAGMRVERTAGDVRVDGSVIATGDGRACIVVDPGVRACIDRDSEVRVADLVMAHRRLDLARGRIAVTLDPQPAGTSFSVSTRDGDVTAIGTAFAVSVDDHAVVARVLHGVVRVHGGAMDERLAAHERIVLSTRARSTPTADDEKDDQSLLDGAPREPAPIAPPPATRAPPPVAKPDVPTAAELLRTARSLRGEHKLAEAAATYRKLQALHPSSNEAHASYVSLGELQLGGLSDPRGALQSFDAYLGKPGALTEEARAGRERALRALAK